ncbi:MAG: hypothetical protein JNM34_02285 [Chthonomonadaceae bacterium]|nr:hypothetical protein [Chthonomonadaceae bacterium]
MKSIEVKQSLFGLTVMSAGAMILGLVVRKIASRRKFADLRQRMEQKLDQMLEDSMDCSDATAQY